jgi:L-asparaginase / beta-aspartyl-peptidase
MDGETLDTGAVTGVEHIKNPILLADAIRTKSRHMFFSGEGAELFATNQGFKLVTPDYFFTDRRWQSLLAAKAGRSDFNPSPCPRPGPASTSSGSPSRTTSRR